MIVVKLQGGLGNQMFQYAFGKHMALKCNTNLKLYISYFANQDLRKYELDKFNITNEIISKEKLNKILYPHSSNLFNHSFNKLTNNYFVYKTISENMFTHDSDILSAGKNFYIVGYWQSEKCFKSIGSIIRQCFQFQYTEQKNQKHIDEIKKTNSISIHIRRGDYVNNEMTKKFHDVCDANYYHQAINYISERVGNSVFFYFLTK